MSATDDLRRMLDERGVEWWQSANTLGCVFTRWYSPLFGDEVCAMENGKEGLVLFDHYLTPEQAIAATLGPREQPPYDELIEALRRDWEIEASWDGLRRFWYVGLTDEGVRRRDEREATLGRGECQKVYLVETSDDLIESWYPFAVYLHREAAEDCAEALRTKSDGVRSFAKVSELKVVDDG